MNLLLTDSQAIQSEAFHVCGALKIAAEHFFFFLQNASTEVQDLCGKSAQAATNPTNSSEEQGHKLRAVHEEALYSFVCLLAFFALLARFLTQMLEANRPLKDVLENMKTGHLESQSLSGTSCGTSPNPACSVEG